MDQQIWNEMLDALTEQLGPGTVRILQSSEVTLEDDTLTYTVPYPPLVERDDRHLMIAAAVQSILGGHIVVQYIKKVVPIEQSMMELGVQPDQKLVDKFHQPITIPLGFGWTELSGKHNGESFCVASFNRSAHAAAQDVINGHEKTLCLIGPSGTGKTHLGQWTLHQLEAQSKRVAFVPAEEFRNNAVYALRNKTDGLEFYVRGFDAVFFDDVQFWKTTNSISSFQRFVQVVAALIAKEVIVILAMHDWPRTYGFPIEMIGRLHEDGLAKIHEPTDEDRLKLVEFRAKSYPNIPNHLVAEMVRTPRPLCDYIGALKDLNRDMQCGATPATISDWMNERCGETNAKILTVDSIIAAVETIMDIPPGTLRAKGRNNTQTHGRQLVWYLLNQHLGMSACEIGELFKKERSGVTGYINKISRSIQNEDGSPAVVQINEAKRLLGVAVEAE